jgi:hypothetical protein
MTCHSEAKKLTEEALRQMLYFTSSFDDAGILIVWKDLLEVAFVEVSKQVFERDYATYEKGIKDKKSDGKVLRKGQRRGSVLRKRKQGQNKRR